MKKKTIIAAVCLSIIIAACRKENPAEPAEPKSKPVPQTAYRLPSSLQELEFSKFIPLDSANKMIGSYLYSINSSYNDSDLRSFTINADSLRSYLDNGDVKNIKLIFAHTLNYINAGYDGVNSGFESGALTIIIAGYDNSGNYVYRNGMVLDHSKPCPYACPSGQAINDYLQ
jgi:hypothetical protein